MPSNIPVEGWTPEYAAQILALSQQGYDANPNIAAINPSEQLMPMGDPAPHPVTNQEQAQLSTAQIAPGSTNGMPPMQPQPQAANVQPGGVQAIPGASFGDRLQQVLPLVAGMAFSMNPRTRHMAPLVMQFGTQLSQQRQGEFAQQQLATLRSNVAQIRETQGDDAARQYLAQTMQQAQLSPAVSKIMDQQLTEMTKASQVKKAIAGMASNKPQDRLQAAMGLASVADVKEIEGLVKTFMPNLQVVQAGDNVFTFDPLSGKLTASAQVPPKFNAAKIGGDDVTQMLGEMGLNAEQVALAAGRGDAQAQGFIQQAAKEISRRKDERSKEHGRAILAGAELQAKATERAAIVGAESRARESGQSLEQGTREKLSMFDEILTDVADVRATMDESFIGPIQGRAAEVKELTGKMGERQAYMRAAVRDAQDLIKRLRTGAAISMGEEQFYSSLLPNENVGWKQFNAQLDRFETAITRKRDEYLRSAKTPRGDYAPKEIKPTYKPKAEETPAAGGDGGDWQTGPGGIKYRVKGAK